MPGKANGRRGCRIPMRLPVMLHWRQAQGAWREVPAETRMLSRHGCLVACSARIKSSDEVMVWWVEKMRYAQARVVLSAVSGDSVEIALEFLGTDDFWEIDFSSATAPPQPSPDPCLAAVVAGHKSADPISQDMLADSWWWHHTKH